MNKVIVLTGSIVGIAYLTELFMAWYSHVEYEWFAFKENRVNLFSPYGWSYWLMMGCNVMSPQIFWFRKFRRNLIITFFMSILVNIGMWFERFVIIVTSLYRDYLPSTWSTYYTPTIWEIGFYMGTFGLFFTCYFLFSKFFPVIAIAEIKHILKKSGRTIKKKWMRLKRKLLRSLHTTSALKQYDTLTKKVWICRSTTNLKLKILNRYGCKKICCRMLLR